MFLRIRRRPAMAGALVVTLGLLAAPRVALADGGEGAEDASRPVDDVAERILEAATLRMKALVEEARLLEAAGRRDEAVAALRRVAAVYDDAMLVVRSHLASPKSPTAPSVPSAVPAAAAGSRRAGRAEPQGTLRVEPSKPLKRPAVDPVGPAVDFLLARQSEDGLFREASGRVEDDPASRGEHDRLATGLAILALADVVGPFPEAAGASPRREVAAVRAAADALARAVSADGALSDDPIDHAYAAWGLATAYSRLGEASWVDSLRRAIAHSLETQQPEGTWDALDLKADGGDGSEGLLAAAAQCGFLLEVLPTAAGEPSDAIRAAVTRARLLAAPASRPPSGAAGLVSDLLRRGTPPTNRRVAFDGVAQPHSRLAASSPESADPFVLLWGTLSLHSTTGFEDDVAGRAWWDDLIVPAMDRQRLRVGPARGSWDPSPGLRGGRLAATAIHLLTWKVPTTEWIEPVAAKR